MQVLGVQALHHIHRERNHAADLIAKSSYSQIDTFCIFADVSEWLKLQLLADAYGVKHQRLIAIRPELNETISVNTLDHCGATSVVLG